MRRSRAQKRPKPDLLNCFLRVIIIQAMGSCSILSDTEPV
ncbi:hypothetical protein BH24ACT17_BH24ACT17_15150 [soil metagenome]